MSRKIALVHDHIQEFGGAERVLVALHKIFPDAPVYTGLYSPHALGIHAKHFKGWNIITSWADRVPFFKRLYSPLRFLAPKVWESFNFDEFDVVISSSGWYMCKGIITKPKTTHICYLHHPPRYLYGYETAVEWQRYWPVKVYAYIVNHFLRIWDFESSQRVDHFIANSQETKKRIEKFYRRNATVIYPPVAIPSRVILNGVKNPVKTNTESFAHAQDDGYYVTTARLAKAKHIDILIHAANKMKCKLKIIGSGRDEKFLKSIAGPTVEFLSHIPDEAFEELYINAKAFLFASVDEEFGIAPVEAMGYGIPVIAYASGGLKEIVQNEKNGYLYDELTDSALIRTIKKFEKLPKEKASSMRKEARKSAEKYSFEVFKKKILSFITLHAKKTTG